MRHLEWTLVIVVLAAFLAPLACGAQEVAEIGDFAQREAVELEAFEGGNAGVVLVIVLLAAVIILVAVILPW